MTPTLNPATVRQFRPPLYASPQRYFGKDLAPTMGPKVAAYIERWLVHGEGDSLGMPVRLTPAQHFILNRLFEYDPQTRRLLYDRALILMGKGNAKTELVAMIGVSELVGPIAPLQSAHVVTSAASFEQADNVFGAAKAIVQNGPLAEHFELLDTEMRPKDDPDFNGFMERRAARAGTADGALPTCFIADELHEWTVRQEDMYDRQRRGLLKRTVPRREGLSGSLLIGISTKGSDRNSLLGRLCDHGRRVAAGEVDDPSLLYLDWEAPKAEDEDLNDPDQLDAAILAANPNVGYFLSLSQLRTAYHTSEEPAKWERLNANRWVSRPRSWVAEAAWVAREAPQVIEDGAEVVLGFKGSYNRHSTALVAWTPDDYGFVVGAWERENEDQDWTVPRDEVEVVLRRAMQRYRVRELVCDPHGWVGEVEAWEREFGERLVREVGDEDEVLQEGTVLRFDVNGKRMQQAIDRFKGAIVSDSRLRHDGDARLARHIRNCDAREGHWGTVLTPPDESRKIDIAQAAIMARQRALAVTAESRSPVLLGAVSFR